MYILQQKLHKMSLKEKIKLFSHEELINVIYYIDNLKKYMNIKRCRKSMIQHPLIKSFFTTRKKREVP